MMMMERIRMRLVLGLWIFTVNSRHLPRKVESAKDTRNTVIRSVRCR